MQFFQIKLIGTQKGSPREVLEERQTVPLSGHQDARTSSNGIGQLQALNWRLAEPVLRGKNGEI